jgi:hypothetical protein
MSKQKKGRVDTQEGERIQQIKRLVVIAMFSDDELMERFVLKGGNAIDLAYQVGSRASVDIDLSMADDFRPEDLGAIRLRIEKNLLATFRPAGYEIFDVTMGEMPEKISAELKGFWGGYVLSFKLIEAAKYAEHSGNLESLRRNAVQIGAKGKFDIDISKFEYCGGKSARDWDGYRIFVYTPEMVVCEKLRAVCQQMREYGPIVHRNRAGSARARDFVDIYQVMESFKLDLATAENRSLLRNIFDAKRVPLGFLDRLPEYREFHRPDFAAVQATVKAGVVLKEFDFYFDYVLGVWARLKALGDV